MANITVGNYSIDYIMQIGARSYCMLLLLFPMYQMRTKVQWLIGLATSEVVVSNLSC